MRRVTLVCTAHKANGRCNEDELLKILLAINPDVIFEELRPADSEAWYRDKSRHTLEMRAIVEYLKVREARQVPVDEYEVAEEELLKFRTLEEFVKSRGLEYVELFDEMCRLEYEIGFSYLNSEACISSLGRSESLYRDTVLKYGNDAAQRVLLMEKEFKRQRDSSMLENILRFAEKHEFSEGVFLVGAGHMLGLLEGIERRKERWANLLTWSFWNRQ